MSNKKWAVILLLAISPTVNALDFGDIITDVVKDGKLSTKKILGAVKSITKVATGQVLGGSPDVEEGVVVLYSTTWCGYCTKAIKYMDSKNIDYVNKDIEDGSDNKSEYQELGGTGGVPFIVFGDQIMKGFSASGFDKHYATFKKEHPVKKATAKEANVKSGDALKGKIAGVKVYKQPKKSAPELIKLSKTDEVIYMGDEKDGYYFVTTSNGEGWVDKLLVQK